MENFEMKKPPIPIGYFQDSGETTKLLLALLIAQADRDEPRMRKIMAALAKAHWLPPPYPASSRRRLRVFAAEHGVRVE
jgi:hypothetical protein